MNTAASALAPPAPRIVAACTSAADAVTQSGRNQSVTTNASAARETPSAKAIHGNSAYESALPTTAATTGTPTRASMRATAASIAAASPAVKNLRDRWVADPTDSAGIIGC